MYLKNCLKLFWAHVKDLFPERQFFIRSRGRVRFLTLSDRQQIALVLVPLFALIGVFGMIGVNFWSQQYSIDLRDQKLALLEAVNDRLLGDRTELLAELTQSQTRFGIVTTELGQNQHAMTSLVRTQAELEHRVSKLKTELAQLNQEQTRYRVNQFALHRRFSQLREHEQAKIIPNLALFGRPIDEGKVEVCCINKVILSRVEYGFHFGPVGC